MLSRELGLGAQRIRSICHELAHYDSVRQARPFMLPASAIHAFLSMSGMQRYWYRAMLSTLRPFFPRIHSIVVPSHP